MSSQDEARRVLRIEADAVRAVADRVGPSFDAAVEAVLACRGRVVVMGMGKSGLIGRKIAATLASIGTPALFVHPAEGGHGDIGMVARGDLAVAVSRSGETDELLAVLPALKRLGVPLLVLTGASGSTLAKEAAAVLDVSVAEEACEMDLVPTASTTASLAMGDALAVAVLKRRGLTPEDYALLHPAGSLGRRLLLRVADIMRKDGEVPRVTAEATLQEAILEMTAKKLGATCVVDADGRLAGLLTDHDLRKALAGASGADVLATPVRALMTVAPLAIGPDMLVAEAIRLTEARRVSVLPVAGPDRRLAGIVHLHDLLGAGVG